MQSDDQTPQNSNKSIPTITSQHEDSTNIKSTQSEHKTETLSPSVIPSINRLQRAAIFLKRPIAQYLMPESIQLDDQKQHNMSNKSRATITSQHKDSRNIKCTQSEEQAEILASSVPRVSNNQLQGRNEEESLFFEDGLRRIDFVLVYTENEEKCLETEKHKWRENSLEHMWGEHSLEKHMWRENFQKYLKNCGLHLEIDITNQNLHFVKVHSPWKVLTHFAELANLKMPYKVKNDMIVESKSRIPSKTSKRQSDLPPVPKYFTAPFSQSREELFVIEDRNSFFTPAQRSLLTYHILRKAVFDPTKNKFGISRMIALGGYDAAYPLHSGSFEEIDGVILGGDNNLRYLLHKTWASKNVWYKTQPLDHIKIYFGEKIALYFAWLGCYTMYLIPASVVGFVVFIFGLSVMNFNIIGKETCNTTGVGSLIMCPLCDRLCNYWKLSDSCHNTVLSLLFDNDLTIVFAFFMSMWAVVFNEMWKRRQAELAYAWGIQNFVEEESLRPEYIAAVHETRFNPVTEEDEPYHNPVTRRVHIVRSICVVLFMICVVIGCFFGIIVYKMTISRIFHSNAVGEIKEYSLMITSFTSACVNLVIILVLGRFYEKLAWVLTDSEFPRTQTQWEDNFTFKMFAFEFVNNYSNLFYIGLFKGKLVGYPGNYNRYIASIRLEECSTCGCMFDLFIQLSVIMVGKQIVNNFNELIRPILTKWFHKHTYHQEGNLKRYERDYLLCHAPKLGVFCEYFEMVIQYGFVTMFVAAFPLAPLCALINNVIEIRLDAFKYTTQFRRPLARQAQNIGVWFLIINGITYIAILTNALIIAFTSEFIPKLVYKFHFSEDGSLNGYLSFSFSIFNVSDFESESVPDVDSSAFGFGNIAECRYRGHRHLPNATEPYKLTSTYWQITAARLAFVLCFAVVVLFFGWFIAYIVPDIPENVKIQMRREKNLAYEAALDLVKSGMASHNEPSGNDAFSEKIESSPEILESRDTKTFEESIVSYNDCKNLISGTVGSSR